MNDLDELGALRRVAALARGYLREQNSGTRSEEYLWRTRLVGELAHLAAVVDLVAQVAELEAVAEAVAESAELREDADRDARELDELDDELDDELGDKLDDELGDKLDDELGDKPWPWCGICGNVYDACTCRADGRR